MVVWSEVYSEEMKVQPFLLGWSTAMMLVELRSMGSKGHSIGLGVGMGGMPGMFGLRCC